MNQPPRPSPASRLTAPGFTLIELLVVIGIVALLIGLLLPVLGMARDTAQQTRDLSNLRQIMTAYTLYQNDHDGHVMWGFPPTTLGGTAVEIRLPDGTAESGLVAQRYPWRLAGYLQDVWAILHSHYPTPEDTTAARYELSLSPSFGLNTTYVGGHQGFPREGYTSVAGVNQPRRGEHVVYRNGEVRRAAELIVFAETQGVVGEMPAFPNAINGGLYFADAPRIGKQEVWRAEAGEVINERPSAIAGLPVGRYGGGASTAFFDGHAAAATPETLDDMRLWANWADGPDYDFTAP
ncbi:MAG: type II secretion system protein [Planctomycetota bacterium]